MGALRTYFVGHSVTLADLAFVAAMSCNRSTVLSADDMKALPNVSRHFSYMTSTTFFQAVMGRSFAPMTAAMPLADSAKTKEFAVANVQVGAPAQGKPAGKAQAKGKQEGGKKQ